MINTSGVDAGEPAWHLPLFGSTPSHGAMPPIGFVGSAVSIWMASWTFTRPRRAGRGSLLIRTCPRGGDGHRQCGVLRRVGQNSPR